MEIVNQLQKQMNDYTDSLVKEGILNDQFAQLQSLQDETNPDFVAEVVVLFFDDSERLLNELATALVQQNVDFKRVDAHVHQLKGSSSSIGAERVQNACVAFRNQCDQKNVDGCLQCLQEVRNEYCLVKGRLEILLKLEQQVIAAGRSIPK